MSAGLTFHLSPQAQARCTGEKSYEAHEMLLRNLQEFTDYVLAEELCLQRRNDGFVAMMQSGELDAMVLVEEQDSAGQSIKVPLLGWLMRHCCTGHMSLLRECLQHESPSALDSKGRPVYVYAHDRVSHRGVRYLPEMWEACLKHPKMDIEIPFSDVVDMDFLGSWPRLKKIEGTLVNQCLSFMQTIRKEYGSGAWGNEVIDQLIRQGAIVDPIYADDPAMAFHTNASNYKVKQLREYIANGKKEQVEALLEQGIAGKMFSLGMANEMTAPDFWNGMEQEALGAIYQLPGWVQERMAPEISAMTMRNVQPDRLVHGGILDGSQKARDSESNRQK